MRILIVGASQGTGALAVSEALRRGHAVTAFARHPERLVLENPNLTRITGDFHDRDSVRNATLGHDAVIITASATKLSAFKETPDYFSRGTAYVIEAMKEQNVQRLVILSALGTGESLKLMNVIARKLVIGWLLKIPFADHERQETITRASGLEWVIARPGRLTDGPMSKNYKKVSSLEHVPSSISRTSVADFLVEAAESDRWLRQSVQLGG
jgi:putative NADH-flavin reductase